MNKRPMIPFASVDTAGGWTSYFDVFGAPEGGFVAASVAIGREQHRHQKMPPVPSKAQAPDPRAESSMREMSERFWEQYAEKHPKPLKTKKPTRLDVAPSRDGKTSDLLRRFMEGERP